MKRSIFLLSAVAVIGLALGSSWRFGGLLIDRFFDHRASSQAVWAYRAQDAAQMARDVDAIVVARFEWAVPGRTAESSKGEATLQFELADFVVENAIKGAAEGSSLTVERTSGTSPTGESGVVFDHDGGPYEREERYLLFLNKQPDTDFYYLVNDEGRYTIGADERLRPVGEGKVASQLAGRPLAEARPLLVNALRGVTSRRSQR